MNRIEEEIAQVAARYIIDDGMEFGPAKHQALKTLGLTGKVPLPSNDELEDAVFEHLNLFGDQAQKDELRALRELALTWMRRLSGYRPHLSGAVGRVLRQHSRIFTCNSFVMTPKVQRLI